MALQVVDGPVNNDTTVERVDTAPIESKLVGLDEAVNELESCKRPEISLPNVLIAVNSIANASALVAENISSSEEATSSTPLSLAISGINLLASNCAQLGEIYEKYKRIIDLQNNFIENIKDQIESCYNGNTVMQGPFTCDKINAFLRKHTFAKIDLTIQNISFTLRDNGFFSWQVSSSAFATVLSVGLFISWGLASQGQIDTGDNRAMYLASLAASSVPLPKLCAALADHCYQQELNILRSMRLVVREVYEKTNQIEKLSIAFLILFTPYVAKELMEKNIRTLDALRSSTAHRLDLLESGGVRRLSFNG